MYTCIHNMPTHPCSRHAQIPSPYGRDCPQIKRKCAPDGILVPRGRAREDSIRLIRVQPSLEGDWQTGSCASCAQGGFSGGHMVSPFRWLVGGSRGNQERDRVRHIAPKGSTRASLPLPPPPRPTTSCLPSFHPFLPRALFFAPKTERAAWATYRSRRSICRTCTWG